MNDPRQRARHLIEQDTITLNRLWVKYWTHGGTGTVFDLDAYLYEGHRNQHRCSSKALAWPWKTSKTPSEYAPKAPPLRSTA